MILLGSLWSYMVPQDPVYMSMVLFGPPRSPLETLDTWDSLDSLDTLDTLETLDT